MPATAAEGHEQAVDEDAVPLSPPLPPVALLSSLERIIGSNATTLYHGNLTDHYNKKISSFEPNCKNCSAAEEALVVAFRGAHSAHTSAQGLAVALLSAHKAYEESEDRLKKERALFASKHDKHDKNVLTPKSSESVFEGYMVEAKELQAWAAAKVVKKSALDAAQVAYDSAAEGAVVADEAVLAAQKVSDADCGHIVGESPHVSTPSPGPASGTDLGYNHPVTCSSGCRNYYGQAEMASNGVIDETRGARRQSGGLAHTKHEQDAWVEVDFEKEFKMGKVTIWNGWQWGCCMGRINPFRLVFFDESRKEVARVTGIHAKTSGDGETPVTLDSPVVARFVRVQLDNHP